MAGDAGRDCGGNDVDYNGEGIGQRYSGRDEGQREEWREESVAGIRHTETPGRGRTFKVCVSPYGSCVDVP